MVGYFLSRCRSFSFLRPAVVLQKADCPEGSLTILSPNVAKSSLDSFMLPKLNRCVGPIVSVGVLAPSIENCALVCLKFESVDSLWRVPNRHCLDIITGLDFEPLALLVTEPEGTQLQVREVFRDILLDIVGPVGSLVRSQSNLEPLNFLTVA